VYICVLSTLTRSPSNVSKLHHLRLSSPWAYYRGLNKFGSLEICSGLSCEPLQPGILRRRTLTTRRQIFQRLCQAHDGAGHSRLRTLRRDCSHQSASWGHSALLHDVGTGQPTKRVSGQLVVISYVALATPHSVHWYSGALIELLKNTRLRCHDVRRPSATSLFGCRRHFSAMLGV
jgi:hypothetical protein